MTFEEEVEQIKTEHCETLKAARNVWIIEERGAEFIVHRWSPGGVGPTSAYPTVRAAASRLLQLLHIGPVAPQTWPEEACIGTVKEGTANAE